MADNLPLDSAMLVSLFAGCILYGVFLVLFFVSLYVLIYKRVAARPNYALISASIVMLFFGTSYLALSLSRVLDGFVVYRDTIGPIGYFDQLYQWKFVTRAALLGVYCLFADCVLIYRCWIVWGTKKVLVVPVILFIANLIVLPFALSVQVHSSDGTPAYVQKIATWIIAFTSLTLLQNITVTGLIAYRIWRINAVARQHGGTSLSPVISLVLETGSLYVTTLFVLLITYVVGSNSLYIVYDMLNQMIGITFTLILVRVGLGLTRGRSSSGGLPQTTPRPLILHSSMVEPNRDVPSGESDSEGRFASRVKVSKDYRNSAMSENVTERSSTVA